MTSTIGTIALAAVACLLVGFPLRTLLGAAGVIDKPNSRSSHSTPVIRGGGIAFLITITAWLAFRPGPGNERAWLLVAAALGIGAVSFIDDLRPIRAPLRFTVHVFGALLVWFGMNNAAGVASTEGFNGSSVLLATGTILWIVGYTNAFNFMDGINGIAAGQAAITGIGMALIAGIEMGRFAELPIVLSAVVAGAALGFLPHNFPKARMFMGDVGSAPLGFVLSALVIWLAKSAGWWLLIPLVLLHANFVLDTAITLLRRVASGDRWYQAHREHFYQRLVRSGRSHAFVTGWEMGLQVIVFALMVVYLRTSVPARVGLSILVVVLWLVFFAFCEISFRKHNAQQSAALGQLVSAPGSGICNEQ